MRYIAVSNHEALSFAECERKGILKIMFVEIVASSISLLFMSSVFVPVHALENTHNFYSKCMTEESTQRFLMEEEQGRETLRHYSEQQKMG